MVNTHAQSSRPPLWLHTPPCHHARCPSRRCQVNAANAAPNCQGRAMSQSNGAITIAPAPTLPPPPEEQQEREAIINAAATQRTSAAMVSLPRIGLCDYLLIWCVVLHTILS